MMNKYAVFGLLILSAAGCHGSRETIATHIQSEGPRADGTLGMVKSGESFKPIQDDAIQTASYQTDELTDFLNPPAVTAERADEWVTEPSASKTDADNESSKLKNDMTAAGDVPPSPFVVDDSANDSQSLPQKLDGLTLEAVIASVHQSYPLIEIAELDYQIAVSKHVAASGAFDTKIKAASENGPTGFYQTYRNSAGVVQPLFDGGEVFGGYRIGRGDFQPWYQERQTNDGGEFKAGLRMPFVRNREIDARRAELWRAEYQKQVARPEVRAQLIGYVRDSSVSYWKWVALGQQYKVAERALKLSEERNGNIKRQVEEGDVDPPVLQDNLGAVAKRKAKLIDRQRKLRQSAIKLSLYSRTSDGAPIIPDDVQLINFPTPADPRDLDLDAGIAIALQQRPEFVALDAAYQIAKVDLAEAENDFLPSVDGQLSASQDVGEPTSKKRDKSEFEVEVGVFFDIPIQRRKARGKSQAAQAKMHQILTKKRFTEDKITTEVQSAFAAIRAAFDRVDRSQEATRLAEYMADVERRKFDLGESDLLKVALREQYALEAADSEIEALFEYFAARAEYSAALATDWPTLPEAT